MKNLISTRSSYPLLLLAILIAFSLACGGSSTSQKLSEASKSEPEQASESSEAPAVEAEQPTEPEVAEVEEAEPAEVEPEPTAEPTETPEPVAEAAPLNLLNQGFGQDGQELGFAFLIENPNESLAVEDSGYQVAIYDDAGTVIKTESGSISLLFPGQTQGVGGTTYLDEGMTASRIEIQVNDGDGVATDPLSAFGIENVIYLPSDFSSKATGIITNPFDRDLENLRISVVAYNGAGEIIGGGFTFLNFILANGTTGVQASLTSAGEVASVELYATVSNLTFLGGDHEIPEGAIDLVLTKQGFGQADSSVGFGLVVENSNPGFAIENSQYRVTTYADDGTVMNTDEGFINVILPQQTLGIGGETFVDGQAVRVEIQIISGEFVASDPLSPFATENVSYQPGDFSSKVTGQVSNPYGKDVTNLRVSSLGYNEAGEIIGGGFTFLDFVPANGNAAVESSITTSVPPTTVELYPTLSGLSEIE